MKDEKTEGVFHAAVLHFVDLDSVASVSVYVLPLYLVPFGLKRKGHCEEKYDMIILLILVYRHTHTVPSSTGKSLTGSGVRSCKCKFEVCVSSTIKHSVIKDLWAVTELLVDAPGTVCRCVNTQTFVILQAEEIK